MEAGDRRSFATAAGAGRARQAFLDEQAATPPSAIAGLTVTELVTRYLDDCEATERLGPKTLFDQRHYLDDYITPWIGSRHRHTTPRTAPSISRSPFGQSGTTGIRVEGVDLAESASMGRMR